MASTTTARLPQESAGICRLTQTTQAEILRSVRLNFLSVESENPVCCSERRWAPAYAGATKVVKCTVYRNAVAPLLTGTTTRSLLRCGRVYVIYDTLVDELRKVLVDRIPLIILRRVEMRTR